MYGTGASSNRISAYRGPDSPFTGCAAPQTQPYKYSPQNHIKLEVWTHYDTFFLHFSVSFLTSQLV